MALQGSAKAATFRDKVEPSNGCINASQAAQSKHRCTHLRLVLLYEACSSAGLADQSSLDLDFECIMQANEGSSGVCTRIL